MRRTELLPLAGEAIMARGGASPRMRQRSLRQAAVLGQRWRYVEQLTIDSINKWIIEWQKEGKAPNTIYNYHGTLSSICEHAVVKGILQNNPCNHTSLPGRRKEHSSSQICFLARHELQMIINGLKVDDQEFVIVAASTGLNFEELTALRADDLRLDGNGAGHITVTRRWKRDEKNKRYIEELVNTTSASVATQWKPRRQVPLEPDVTTILKRRAQHDTMRPRLNSDGLPIKLEDDYLFCDNSDGDPLDYNRMYARWNRAVAKAQRAGLAKTPRIGDLRHTHASWLLQAGESLETVAARLGESLVATINRYGPPHDPDNPDSSS